MTTPGDQVPKPLPRPRGRGIPRSEDQAMVMTRMLMRWKPLGRLRDRRKHKTAVNINTAAPGGPPHFASGEVERDRRQARAEQCVHRFVGLTEADAQLLADELDLPVRFFRRGETLTEANVPGRVTAQLEDGIVVAARAMH